MTRRKSLGVGSVSLILIFCVLCLTIFSLLTLSFARSESALTQKLADSVQNYYAADMKATQALAELEQALSSGEQPAIASGLEMNYSQTDQGLLVSFLSHIDRQRSIAITAVYIGGSFDILRWQETENAYWSPDNTIPVIIP